MTYDPMFGCCSFLLGWLILAGVDSFLVARHLKVLSKSLSPRFLVANGAAMVLVMLLHGNVSSSFSNYSVDPYLSSRVSLAATWCAIFAALVLVKWPFVKAAGGPSFSWAQALRVCIPAQAAGYALIFGTYYVISYLPQVPGASYRSTLSRASELPAAWIYFADEQEGTLNRVRFGDFTGYIDRVAEGVPSLGREPSSAIIWQPKIGYAVHLFSYTWSGSAWSYKLPEQPDPSQLEYFSNSYREALHSGSMASPSEGDGIRSFMNHDGIASPWGFYRTLQSNLVVFDRNLNRYSLYASTAYSVDVPTSTIVLPNGFAIFNLGRRIYIADLMRREVTYWREGSAPCVLLDKPGLKPAEREWSRQSEAFHLAYEREAFFD